MPAPAVAEKPKTEHEINQAAIAEFLAEGHKNDDPATPGTEPAGDEPAEPIGDDPASDDEDGAEARVATSDDYDVNAITEAIDAKDVRALINALGPAADELLGSKAHRALRVAIRELTTQEKKVQKIAGDLQAKYGDPIAVRAAAAKGDINAALDSFERQWGMPWTEIVRQVNAAAAGKPARLEYKAAQAPPLDPQAQQKNADAVLRLKSAITDTVKKVDKKLAGVPDITDRIYAAMQAGYSRGITTPAKALVVVKADLKKLHATLGTALSSKAEPPPARTRPPREEASGKGDKQTEEEFRKSFIREQGAGRRGMKVI